MFIFNLMLALFKWPKIILIVLFLVNNYIYWKCNGPSIEPSGTPYS